MIVSSFHDYPCILFAELDLHSNKAIDCKGFIHLSRLEQLERLNLYRTSIDVHSLITVIRSVQTRSSAANCQVQAKPGHSREVCAKKQQSVGHGDYIIHQASEN